MRKILFFIFLSLSYLNIFSQIVFNNSNITSKLSSPTIKAIYQDKRGFIWIGTDDGLNLFDGNDVKIFKTNISNINSIVDNRINDVIGDDEDNIYVSTQNGISCIDAKTEKVTTLINAKAYKSFYYKHKIYFSVGNSIYCYGNKKFNKILVTSSKIHSFVIKDNQIYLGTQDNGLYVYNLESKKTYNFLNDLFVQCLYIDSKNRCNIGTHRNGYFVYDINKKTVKKMPNVGKDNDIRSFCEDADKNLWIGSMNGLYKKEKDNTYKLYKINDSYDKLNHTSIWVLMKDKQNNLWVGSYFGGVVYFNPTDNSFKNYNYGANTINFPIVGEIIEDDGKNIWICTDGGGVNCIDGKTGNITYLTTDEGLNHNNVKCLYFDKTTKELLIGEHMGGLDGYDIKTKKIKHYLRSKSAKRYIPNNSIDEIARFENHFILSTTDGIFGYDHQKDSVFTITKNSIINKNLTGGIFTDKKNNLWIGGGTFINLLTKKTYKKILIKDLPKKIKSCGIQSFFEDSEGKIFVCTKEIGLLVYDNKENIFKRISCFDSETINNCTLCMCELNKNQYLVTTNKGFYIYDYGNNILKHYFTKNELSLTSLLQPSLLKATNGNIYLGGIDGLISFSTHSILHNDNESKVYPTKLLINGIEISVNDKTNILQNVISYTNKIRLDESQSNFCIEFSNINFSTNHSKDLEYKLEGYSNKWIPMAESKSIFFNNLTPGNYNLNVRTIGETNQTSLKIEIYPPFFKTKIAYLIYLIAAILIILYFVRRYKLKIKEKEELRYEKKRVEDIEKINQAKINFFTNISHEFRTPLTLIIGYTDKLLKNNDISADVRTSLGNIQKAGKQLNLLITELLDFRKQEQDKIQLNKEITDLSDFIPNAVVMYREYAKENGIKINFITCDRPYYAMIDQIQIQKVINNIISNALKHTTSGDSITINISSACNNLDVSIRDTGCGIKESELGNIFRKFYQLDPSSIGTGLGLTYAKEIVEMHGGKILVSSKEGEGSDFSIILPEYCELNNQTTQDKNIELSECKEYESTKERNNEINVKKEKNNNNILIVEDNKDLRNLLKELLSPYYNVFTASNGEEGLEKTNTILPDIIISDIIMPKMSGIELCKKIKQDSNTNFIPFILLTAKATNDSKAEGYEIGADDYITKPFDTNLLLLKCNNIIKSRSILRSKYTSKIVEEIHYNNKDKDFMNSITKYIHENISNNITVDDIALNLCISRSKFFMQLKRITNKTPLEIINGIRMEKACYMLENHLDMNITDISIKVGFSSARYFSKCFKEFVGTTPLEYRKNIKEKSIVR